MTLRRYRGLATPVSGRRNRSTAPDAGPLAVRVDPAERLAALTRLRVGRPVAGRVRIAVAVVLPTGGGVSFGPPKSARSRRTIALDDETTAAIAAHRATQLLERDLASGAYDDLDLVFCDELGAPIYPQRLTEWFRGHCKAAGIPTGSLHVLRHTAATLMLTNGTPVHVAAARLGDTPTTVLNTYAHLLPSSDEIAAERVAALIESEGRI
jgi:integrase